MCIWLGVRQLSNCSYQVMGMTNLGSFNLVLFLILIMELIGFLLMLFKFNLM